MCVCVCASDSDERFIKPNGSQAQFTKVKIVMVYNSLFYYFLYHSLITYATVYAVYVSFMFTVVFLDGKNRGNVKK